MTYKNIPKEELNMLLYPSGKINTPLLGTKKIPIVYADFIASGLPSPCIEKEIEHSIYPYYANTHSNAHNGIFMKSHIENTKNIIRKQMNCCGGGAGGSSGDYNVLFSGSGVTGCINQLVNTIEYTKYKKIIIYLSLYEHYSNHLPWVEQSHKHSYIEIRYIPFVGDCGGGGGGTVNEGIIDTDWLDEDIRKATTATATTKANKTNTKTAKRTKTATTKTLIICSVSACSNVSGYVLPLTKIHNIIKKHRTRARSQCQFYFFCDYACSAPYVPIDGSLFDAFMFSGHKFIGGPSSPGVLVAKSCLFTKDIPSCVGGGGCSRFISDSHIEYDDNIETRESAGTPNILGIIRIGMAIQMKALYQATITRNENWLCRRIKEKSQEYKHKYPAVFYDILPNEGEHLPIFSFYMTTLDCNLIVVLLNDLYGIQTRGGKSCSGLLAKYTTIHDKIQKWCRVSFHWTMTIDVINFIFSAIDDVLERGGQYKDLYVYNEDTHLFTYCGGNKVK